MTLLLRRMNASFHNDTGINEARKPCIESKVELDTLCDRDLNGSNFPLESVDAGNADNAERISRSLNNNFDSDRLQRDDDDEDFGHGKNICANINTNASTTTNRNSVTKTDSSVIENESSPSVNFDSSSRESIRISSEIKPLVSIINIHTYFPDSLGETKCFTETVDIEDNRNGLNSCAVTSGFDNFQSSEICKDVDSKEATKNITLSKLSLSKNKKALLLQPPRSGSTLRTIRRKNANGISEIDFDGTMSINNFGRTKLLTKIIQADENTDCLQRFAICGSNYYDANHVEHKNKDAEIIFKKKTSLGRHKSKKRREKNPFKPLVNSQKLDCGPVENVCKDLESQSSLDVISGSDGPELASSEIFAKSGYSYYDSERRIDDGNDEKDIVRVSSISRRSKQSGDEKLRFFRSKVKYLDFAQDKKKDLHNFDNKNKEALQFGVFCGSILYAFEGQCCGNKRIKPKSKSDIEEVTKIGGKECDNILSIVQNNPSFPSEYKTPTRKQADAGFPYSESPVSKGTAITESITESSPESVHRLKINTVNEMLIEDDGKIRSGAIVDVHNFTKKSEEKVDMVEFDDNIENYLESTGHYGRYDTRYNLGHDQMSAVSGLTSTWTGASSTAVSIHTQSTTTSTQSSARKRTTGSAKNRIARVKKIQNTSVAITGWKETIRAAAKSTNNVWDSKNGWANFQDSASDIMDFRKDNLISAEKVIDLKIAKRLKDDNFFSEFYSQYLKENKSACGNTQHDVKRKIKISSQKSSGFSISPELYHRNIFSKRNKNICKSFKSVERTGTVQTISSFKGKEDENWDIDDEWITADGKTIILSETKPNVIDLNTMTGVDFDTRVEDSQRKQMNSKQRDNAVIDLRASKERLRAAKTGCFERTESTIKPSREDNCKNYSDGENSVRTVRTSNVATNFNKWPEVDRMHSKIKNTGDDKYQYSTGGTKKMVEKFENKIKLSTINNDKKFDTRANWLAKRGPCTSKNLVNKRVMEFEERICKHERNIISIHMMKLTI